MNKLLALIACCLIGTVGHILIKKGLNRIGEFGLSQILSHVGVVLTNTHILAALGLYAVGVFIYFSLLSRSQLSILYPVAVGIDFMLLAIASRILFDEAFTPLKISGFLLIFLGISCVFYSKA